MARVATKSTAMASPSPSIRLLGRLEQPEPDPHDISPLELEEGDVVWSSDDTDSHSSSNLSASPTNHFRPHPTQLGRSNYGLSAALSDDHHPLVRRKSTLNPVTSAAKMIPPVVKSENSNLTSSPGAWLPQSAPVNVPVWSKKKTGEFGLLERLDELDDDIDEEEEMVPPHVIVSRSHVTFSVFEGSGRTLKGRDLRQLERDGRCWVGLSCRG